MTFSPSGLGKGLSIGEWSVTAINRHTAALVKGDCVVLDIAASSAALAANYNDGTDLDPLANVIRIAANNVTGATGMLNSWAAIGMIADDDVAVGSSGKFWIRHPDVFANVVTGVAAGDALVLPVTAVLTLQSLDSAIAAMAAGAGAKIVGFAHAADASGEVNVTFDGYNGFGVAVEGGS